MRIVNVIKDFGPKLLIAGETFNSSSLGSNVFWVILNTTLGNPTVIINGLEEHPVNPAYDKSRQLLTFEVVASMTALEGELRFQIYDLMLDIKTEEVTVQVDKGEQINVEALREDAVRLSSLKSKPVTFAGLGMSTSHSGPWEVENGHAEFLLKLHKEIEQTFHFSFGDVLLNGKLNAFLWRTSILVQLLDYTMHAVAPLKYLTVECGVGDGLTAFAAMAKISSKYGWKGSWHSFLFDLWDADNVQHSDLEKHLDGVYSSLSLERTRNNLRKFDANSTLIQGHLPGSLDGTEFGESGLAFVHIDLNFAIPTLDCAVRLLPKMAKGSVMLFDDYGWSPHKQTRDAMEEFLRGNGPFMMFPTGQAALFIL